MSCIDLLWTMMLAASTCANSAFAVAAEDPKVQLHGVQLAEPEKHANHTGINSRTGTLYYPPQPRCRDDPRSNLMPARNHYGFGNGVIALAAKGAVTLHHVESLVKPRAARVHSQMRPTTYTGPFAAV